MNEELEPEVLSYREFKKRETLLAWERRRRASESTRYRDAPLEKRLPPRRGGEPPRPAEPTRPG